jgi:YegS/Rv2252/BmrU family lipid kinase
MRKAALIYNPASGTRRDRRLADVERAAQVLRRSGVEAALVPTRAASSAGEQACEAAASGCDAVLACGGDGTVHDVLQGLVGFSGEVTLGVVPLGTGNALACDLGVPRDPAAAASALLTATPRRVAAGRIEYCDRSTAETRSRYFLVMAGVGADAQMLYRMNLGLKARFGMAAYYAEGTRMYALHRLEPFAVEFPRDGPTRQEVVSQLMAVRVSQFGGVLRALAPDAGLYRDDLQFILFKTRSRFLYALFLARGFAGKRWRVPGIELVHGKEITCRSLAPSAGAATRIYAQADGELLGELPVRISMVPDAISLLFPQK